MILTGERTGTTYVTTGVCPMGDAEPPVCRMGGIDASIPVIDFGDVEILLANHADPVAYLRTFAVRVLELADQVERRAS